MRVRMIMMALLLVVSGVLSGCGDDTAATTTPVNEPEVAEADPTPEELGELGVRLEKNPEQIEEILDEHGMTLESYEAAIRRVTENPAEAKRYTEAYESASS